MIMEYLTVERPAVERKTVEREKYEGQLRKFLLRCKSLDESLTLFFSQLFSKEAFVTSNFFSLVEKMKTLDGACAQSVLKSIDEQALITLVQRQCASEMNPNAEYVFEGGVISYNKKTISRSFYDPDRKISLSDLRDMRDFKLLSFLNAFDLPYLTDTRIDRSSFEHFVSSFLKDVVPDENSESPEVLRFRLIENASAHLGYTINSWVQILYLVMRIMAKIHGLAIEAMEQNPQEYYSLEEKIQFFKRFASARKKFLEAKEMPEATESFTDFLRIDFMRITEGNSVETKSLKPLALLEFEINQLDSVFSSSKANSKQAVDFFRRYHSKKNLSTECRQFCEMSIRFQFAFEKCLEAVMEKENVYQLALKSGIQLLKVLYPEAFPDIPLDPKSSSNTPTPRSHRTPRDDSPRVLGRNNSPRDTLRSSAGAQDPSRAAQMEIWKRRKSVGGGAPPSLGGSDGRLPGLTRSSGSEVK